MTRITPRSAAAALAPRPTRGRLTDVERAERALTEAEFQHQVTDLAEALGWSWIHFRPGLRANGRWYVPVEGPLGKGWPDLVLARARGRDRRIVFAELKRELGQPTPEQLEVRGLLLEIGLATWAAGRPAVDHHVWRPSDLRDPIESSRIYEVLR